MINKDDHEIITILNLETYFPRSDLLIGVVPDGIIHKR